MDSAFSQLRQDIKVEIAKHRNDPKDSISILDWLTLESHEAQRQNHEDYEAYLAGRCPECGGS